MADAELLITPDIARTDLMRSINTRDNAFKRLSKQIERDLADAISNEGGIDLNTSRRLMGLGVGPRAASRMAGGIVQRHAAGLLDESIHSGATMSDHLGHSTAAQERAIGRAAGLSDVQLEQFALDMAKTGMADRAELSELLVTLSAAISKSEFEGTPMLKEFAKLKPEERVGAVLASIGNLSGKEQLYWLGKLEVDGENVGALMTLLEKKRAGSATGTLRTHDIFGAADPAKASIEANRATTSTDKEIALADTFRRGGVEQALSQREMINESISGGDISAYFCGQEGVPQEQRTLIEPFQQNLGAANTAQASHQEAMTALVSNTAETITKLNEIITKMGDPVQAARQQAENEALRSTRGQAHYVTGNTSPLSPLSSLAYSPRGR